MKNLAGDQRCDGIIVRELLEAGINIIPRDDVGQSEVPSTLFGEVAGWRFFRAWSYWMASPISPNRGLALEKANSLYSKWGNEIRAGGDCACREPETWVTNFTNDNKQVVVDEDGSFAKTAAKLKMDLSLCAVVESLEDVEYESYVDSYHIDSQAGLNAFVELIKKQ